MKTYTIYLGTNPIACLSGCEAVYACYEAAKTIAEMTNRTATLVWDETGEEVAFFDPEEID
jgi:hypothetical protein